MPTYISLIRGINVGGHKKVGMEPLRKAVSALGFKNVRTYIQSGNIIFEGPKQSTSAISKKIESILVQEFGHAASVITKTPEELGSAIAKNPFLKEKAIDPSRLHVTFLTGCPAPADLKRLEAIPSGTDRFQCQGDVLYLHLPGGMGNSKLGNAPFEKLLSVRGTARNWRTVNALHEMALNRG
ncbi:MAG TPA: DUF1697 domain-containing protein [Terriglobales bacterium]|nr:DUF1697 domain-containing protein [Terriglobales bacterium]